MDQSLYEQLGGKKTVEKAATFLYVNILRDDRIKDLTYIFGGPSLYLGKDMRRAHEHAVANGLNDEHVDAMMECVTATLHELNIENDLITTVINTIEKHRDDVLNR